MRANEKKYTMTLVIGLALMLSTTACTGSEPAAETTSSSTVQSNTVQSSNTSAAPTAPTTSATPSSTPTPRATPSSAATPSPAAPTGQASTPVPAPETSPTTEAPAPVAPQPAPPAPPASSEASAVTTPEQAIELIRAEDGYNPDFQYVASPDPEGDPGFEVIVRSISLSAGGGSGTVEVWQVYTDGTYSRDN